MASAWSNAKPNAAEDMPTDDGIPPQGDEILFWKGSVFSLAGAKVACCVVWPVRWFLHFDFSVALLGNEGQPVVWLKSLGSLYVFGFLSQVSNSSSSGGKCCLCLWFGMSAALIRVGIGLEIWTAGAVVKKPVPSILLDLSQTSSSEATRIARPYLTTQIICLIWLIWEIQNFLQRTESPKIWMKTFGNLFPVIWTRANLIFKILLLLLQLNVCRRMRLNCSSGLWRKKAWRTQVLLVNCPGNYQPFRWFLVRLTMLERFLRQFLLSFLSVRMVIRRLHQFLRKGCQRGWNRSNNLCFLRAFGSGNWSPKMSLKITDGEGLARNGTASCASIRKLHELVRK